MTEPREAWREVAGKAEALGLKLKLHLEQEHEPSDEAKSAQDAADAKAVMDDLGRKVQDVFDSIGNAAKDPAVHEDVKDVGRLFVDALSSTFSAVGAEVNARTSGAGSSADAGVDSEEASDGATGDEGDGGDG